MTNQTAEVRPELTPGTWVIYDLDYLPYLVSTHATMFEAIVHHNRGYIAYLPYGMDLNTAVKFWEEFKKEYTSVKQKAQF